MALLAETSSGFVLALNAPNEKIVLLKSMNVKYNKLSQGDMWAIANIDETQALSVQKEEKGNLIVPVKVYDQSNQSPIDVEMNWAWVLKNKKNINNSKM